MSVVKLEGIVSSEYEPFAEYAEFDCDLAGPLIGGVNVIEALRQADFYGKGGRISVALFDGNRKSLEGEAGGLYADEGSPGYSEWTPCSSCDILIAGHDIYERLMTLVGHEVTLWVSDEPIDLLADGGIS